MRRSIPSLLALLALSLLASPARAQAPATFPGARSILWIGAHPDDELLAAPLLGRLCLQERLDCTFLVLTRGEAGTCALPGGCSPDLGTVRSREMRRAAQLFGAGLEQWSLPDADSPSWDDAGGDGPLVERLAAFLDGRAPDLVLTFDPRHGSTCHADHRAAGEAVLAAVERAARPPVVYLLETRLTIASPPRFTFSPAAPPAAAVLGYDGNTRLDSVGLSGWQLLLLGAKSHSSQFDRKALRALEKVPPRQRAVYFAPAGLALEADGVFACP